MFKVNSKLEKQIITPSDKHDIQFDYSMINHLDDVMKKEVLNFINTVKTKNPDWNFTSLFNNLPYLTFKKDNIKTTLRDAKAYYYLKKRIIYYTKLDDIPHELIHASTHEKIDKINLCGFCQSKGGLFKRYSIGYGLNEGYASFLEGLYFSHASYYIMEETIAKNLSKISDEKTTSFFNNMDLLGFITFMEKYENTHNTFNFIQMLDYICLFQKDLYKKVQKEIIDLYYECLLYTFRCYIYKLLNDVENKIISVDLANKYLSTMITLSPNKILLGAETMYDVNFLIDLKKHVPDLHNISSGDISRLKLEL